MRDGLSFSLRDELAASGVSPIAAWKRTDQLLRIWSSFAALDSGTGTLDDVGICIEAANLVTKLVDAGQVRDPDGLLPATGREFQALFQAGAPYRMPAGSAYECVLRDYSAFLAILPARTVIRAIRRAEIDMRKAHAGHLPGATVLTA